MLLFQHKLNKAEDFAGSGYLLPEEVSWEYDRQLKEVRRQNRKEEREQGRCIGDAGEFLSKVKKEDRLRPVITLVVYWGEEKWQGADSLHSILGFGEDDALAENLKRLVPEYPLHFLNLSEVHDYSSFQTELRTLFELYDRRNDKAAFGRYLEEHEACKRMDAETYYALCVLTNAKELGNGMIKEEKGDIDVCKAIWEMIEEGREEGIKQGEVFGRLETLAELVRDNILSVKDAAARASMSEKVFRKEMEKAGF